jgi:hypothetical protein
MTFIQTTASLAWIYGAILAAASPQEQQEVWVFDSIESIGGHPVTVVGHPRVIDTPIGKAVHFNGVDDGLLMEVHPLAGAESFTWEAIFRPDGGAAEQRWFHLQANPGSGGVDPENRMLFEIRVIDGRWCLDAFSKSGSEQKALLYRDHLHPLGEWYRVAAVYDGKEFRSYVNGVLDGKAEVRLAPQGVGRAAVGMRMNRVFYFNGAVRMARFTRRALAPSEFLKQP